MRGGAGEAQRGATQQRGRAPCDPRAQTQRRAIHELACRARWASTTRRERARGRRLVCGGVSCLGEVGGREAA